MGASRFRPAKHVETWGEWIKKPETLANRGDIINYVRMYDSALLARLPQLIAEQRLHRRLVRWIKVKLARKPKPDLPQTPG